MWSVLASPLKCFLTKDQPPTWTLPTSTPAAPVTLAAADSIYNKPSNPDTLHYSFTRLVPNSLHYGDNWRTSEAIHLTADDLHTNTLSISAPIKT